MAFFTTTHQNKTKSFPQVSIDEPVFIYTIEIYETYHAGAVKEVSVRHEQRGWVTVWSGSPQVIKSSRIFKPDLRVRPIYEIPFYNHGLTFIPNMDK